MKYLCIQNKNEVDRFAFTLLGASVKERDDSIGMFGSGTKYSLATLIRNGLEPRIFSGTDEIIIGAKATSFRGQDFSIITIDGKETSITTNTGLKWRVDQCVREFYSNALDEGEALAFVTTDVEGQPGTTRVYIPMDSHPTPGDMWREWHKYFLNPEAKPLASNGRDRLYPVSATGNVPSIMRRGVWCVEDWAGYEAIFSYNVHDVHLPETRLINATSARAHAVEPLLALVDEPSIEMLLAQSSNEKSYEWYCLYYTWNVMNPKMKAIMEKKFDWIATRRDLVHFPTSLHSRVLVCSDNAFSFLFKAGFKDIRSYRNSDLMYHEMAWPIGYQDRVLAIKAKLAKNGINLDFPIKYASIPNLSEGKVIALADMRAGLCIITPTAFEDSDDRQLTKALIEEWTHLKFRVVDGSVDQQHVYLDTIIKLLK